MFMSFISNDTRSNKYGIIVYLSFSPLYVFWQLVECKVYSSSNCRESWQIWNCIAVYFAVKVLDDINNKVNIKIILNLRCCCCCCCCCYCYDYCTCQPCLLELSRSRRRVHLSRVRKMAKRDLWLRHARSPSAGPHGTTRLPLDGFSWNLIWAFFENGSRKFKFH